ncbi:hypothetical protein KJ713_00285 [Patescibacteria group bacterium]|nr:hypothetical protein [Patescibacteria group bacterium]
METISVNETPNPLEPATTPKPKKWPLTLFVILTIVFFLGAGALGYLYWQKNDSYKKLNQTNQEKQQQLDQSNKDKAGLEKQIADLTQENEDLKKSNKESDEAKANKKTIIEAYTEILAYFAQVVETHGGFTGWTNAEYLHARDIAKKTQSTGFLATVDWAWNQTSVDPTTRVVRFLKEIASGINENL